MNLLYSELEWPLSALNDFSERLKGRENSSGPLGGFRFLVQYGLNPLPKLAQALGKAEAGLKALNPPISFRLMILSKSTIDLEISAEAMVS